MVSFEATATREGRWWVVTVKSPVLAAQVRRLADVDEVITSVVAAALDLDENEVAVEVSVELPGGAAAMLAAAAEQEARARSQLEVAGQLRRQAVTELVEQGISQRDLAYALNLSPQRINQLARGEVEALGERVAG